MNHSCSGSRQDWDAPPAGQDSRLRKKTPTDEKLDVGHRGAVDRVPYHWEPALQALEQPRQRVLIADATGRGKTIEAGILMSELIERDRGKRIRQRIPAGHNPFYYEKTIISIDTLKRGAEDRTFIEDASWDIVLIDEVQNAAREAFEITENHRLQRPLAEVLKKRPLCARRAVSGDVRDS